MIQLKYTPKQTLHVITQEKEKKRPKQKIPQTNMPSKTRIMVSAQEVPKQLQRPWPDWFWSTELKEEEY